MAEKFLESLKKDFAKKALYDLTKTVVLAVAVISISMMGSKAIVLQLASLEPFKWHLSVVFGALGAFAFLLIRERYNRLRPRFPAIDLDFQILEKAISYEYVERHKMVYRKKIKLKALRNGLDTYRDKYRWTGTGLLSMKSIVQEHDVVETVRKNVWRVYEIRFQRSLRKGDTIETEIEWTLQDDSCSAVPFFSATIEEPTDCLLFNLKIIPAFGVREVTCEVSSHIGSGRPFKSWTIPVDKHGEAAWRINGPELLYYYEMRWTFVNGPETNKL